MLPSLILPVGGEKRTGDSPQASPDAYEVLDTTCASIQSSATQSQCVCDIHQRRMLVSFESLPPKKKPARVHVNTDEKLLVGRGEAAQMLSISERALDYLVAHKQLTTRRIGSRVLIPTSDLRRFTRSDHPERLTG
jgi:hypothetical protein